MNISAHSCTACGIEIKGRFGTSRIARLPTDMLHLAEAFLLSGGNLKQLAPELNVSYPTLRKRVDALVDTLRALQESDRKQIALWLQAVERREMSAEETARMIREINGES